MNKTFSDIAWNEYLYWIQKDKKIAKRINELLKDIKRSNFDGIGKPEALRHDLSGCWSRRITDRDRLIYKILNNTVYIISCKGHYDD